MQWSGACLKINIISIVSSWPSPLPLVTLADKWLLIKIYSSLPPSHFMFTIYLLSMKVSVCMCYFWRPSVVWNVLTVFTIENSNWRQDGLLTLSHFIFSTSWRGTSSKHFWPFLLNKRWLVSLFLLRYLIMMKIYLDNICFPQSRGEMFAKLTLTLN